METVVLWAYWQKSCLAWSEVRWTRTALSSLSSSLPHLILCWPNSNKPFNIYTVLLRLLSPNLTILHTPSSILWNNSLANIIQIVSFLSNEAQTRWHGLTSYILLFKDMAVPLCETGLFWCSFGSTPSLKLLMTSSQQQSNLSLTGHANPNLALKS